GAGTVETSKHSPARVDGKTMYTLGRPVFEILLKVSRRGISRPARQPIRPDPKTTGGIFCQVQSVFGLDPIFFVETLEAVALNPAERTHPVARDKISGDPDRSVIVLRD